jgi:hypothetical protein
MVTRTAWCCFESDRNVPTFSPTRFGSAITALPARDSSDRQQLRFAKLRAVIATRRRVPTSLHGIEQLWLPTAQQQQHVGVWSRPYSGNNLCATPGMLGSSRWPFWTVCTLLGEWRLPTPTTPFC